MLKEKRMTFGEHLEELRRRIIYCLFIVAAGVLVGWFAQEPLMELALRPHQKALGKIERGRGGRLAARQAEALAQARKVLEGRQADELPWRNLLRLHWQGEQIRKEAGKLAEPLLEDVDDPRVRDMVTRFCQGLTAFVYRVAKEWTESTQQGRVIADWRRLLPENGLRGIDLSGGEIRRLEPLASEIKEWQALCEKRRAEIAGLSSLPASSEMPAQVANALREVERAAEAIDKGYETVAVSRDKESARIAVIGYMEQFAAYLKMALLFGVFISVPFILHQLWLFIGAGLYPHEQRVVRIFLPFALINFGSGVLFGYFILIPIGLRFLGGYGSDTLIQPNFILSQYVSLLITLTLVLGVAFELPLVMLVLTKIGITTPRSYVTGWKYSILAAFALGGVLTPPDPFTQGLLAGPLIALYGAGIIASMVATRKRKESPGEEARPE